MTTLGDLLTPAPPGITTQNPSATPASGSWLATLLSDAAALGLPTTAWQSGDPILTNIQILAVELSKLDGGVSLQVQGGFLDYAANGTVTLTDLDGSTATVPVSPDPSIPGQNPTGAPTFLDLLAHSVYNVSRLPATAASNPLYVVNTTASGLGTFVPGTFHVENVLTQATYTNQASFTLSPSAIIGTSISGYTTGSTVVISTSAAHGLTTGAVVYVSSQNGFNFGGSTVWNGFASVTVLSSTSFSLNGVTGAGTITGLVYSPQQVVFAADLVGPAGNAAVAAISQLVTAAPGAAVGNLQTFAGSPWQSNAALASYCRAKLATLSPNGAPGAFAFYAFAAYLILTGGTLPGSPPAVLQAVSNYLSAAGLPPLINPLPAAYSMTGGAVTRVKVSTNLATGSPTVTVANSNGAVPGCINNAVSGATAASPIVITSTAHGCSTGDYVQTNGIQGVTGANGVFQCTVVDANHLSLNGSTGTGAYVASTGQLSGGALYAVNAVLAAYCTPLGVTVVTQAANNVNVTIAATIYVPKAYVSQYQNAINNTVIAYIGAFPIGGINVDNQLNILPIGAIEGILFASGQQNGQFYVQSIFGLTLNGSANDLVLGATGVPTNPNLSGITIVGT